MIVNIEKLIKDELEHRIARAMPELPVNDEGFPKCVLTYVASRKFIPQIQEQQGVKFYGLVSAVFSVQFNSKGQAFIDKSPLFASFLENPYLAVDGDTHPLCTLESSNVAEGPHLDIDIIDFRITYPIYKRLEGQGWQPPIVLDAAHNSPDLYPRPEWDSSHEPEEHI